MVFQLPHTGLPIERVQTRMATYDHGHAYLHSRSLRWSWGAIVGRNANWQGEVQRCLPPPWCEPWPWPASPGSGSTASATLRRVRQPRDGRRVGLGPNPEAAIARASGEPPETSLDQRYVFLSLEGARRRLVSRLGPEGYERAKLEVLRPPLVPRFLEGVGEEEGEATEVRRWVGARGRIVIKNTLDREREVLITARLRSPDGRPQPVEVASSQFTDGLVATAQGSPYRRTALLPARRRLQLQLSCPDRPAAVTAPCFQLVDFQVVDVSPRPEIAAPGDDAADQGE